MTASALPSLLFPHTFCSQAQEGRALAPDCRASSQASCVPSVSSYGRQGDSNTAFTWKKPCEVVRIYRHT